MPNVISLYTAQHIMTELNDLLHSNVRKNPHSLPRLLELLGSSIKLTDSIRIIDIVRENVMVVAARENEIVEQLQIYMYDTDIFIEPAVYVVTSSNMNKDDTHYENGTMEAFVRLPSSLREGIKRINFAVLRKDYIYTNYTSSIVNSRIISVFVDNFTIPENEAIEINMQRIRDPDPNETLACAHLDTDSNRWSQDGCTLVSAKDSLFDTCRCTNLSTFSLILTKRVNLKEVISKMNMLLRNNDAIILTDNKELLNEVDNLFEKNETSNELLTLLDEFGARLNLEGSDKQVDINKNFVLIVAEANVRGVRIPQERSFFTKEDFVILRNDTDNTDLSSETSEVVVVLPDSVSESRRRVSFVVFRNNRAFSGDSASVNSRVLSVNIDNTSTFHNGEVIEIYLLPSKRDIARNQRRACAYWSINVDGSGKWSQDGCKLIPPVKGSLDKCQCNHLTHFAEVIISKPIFSEENETTLEIISVTGCCVSIMGIIFIIFTAVVFSSWRRNYSHKIWLQLSVSILILSVMFLIVVFVRLESSGALCTLTGVALHYLVLSSFCWMLVAAVLSYRRLVTVFTRDASHKLLRAAAFAWGAPCAVIGVLLSINPQAYEAPFEEQAPSGAFCYPSGLALWLAVYGPIALMLLANWTLFALIIRSVFASKTISNINTNDVVHSASINFLLMFLFGLPWIFGLISYNIVAAYFTSLSTFQGFILFVLIILGKKSTRDLWLIKFKFKQRNVTGSSFMMR